MPTFFFSKVKIEWGLVNFSLIEFSLIQKAFTEFCKDFFLLLWNKFKYMIKKIRLTGINSEWDFIICIIKNILCFKMSLENKRCIIFELCEEKYSYSIIKKRCKNRSFNIYTNEIREIINKNNNKCSQSLYFTEKNVKLHTQQNLRHIS